MTYGIGPDGFAVKPLAQVVTDLGTAMQQNVPTADLSTDSIESKIVAIFAGPIAELWALSGQAFNAFNRQDVEGAGLDNLGDLTGTPREGSSYTQVPCTLTLTAGTYPPGTLVANVAGSPAFTFSNPQAVVSAGGETSVTMQATTIGTTATVNPGTLTQITAPVTGWTSITNAVAQSQQGAEAELDPLYAIRQEEELADQGSCTAPAMAAALIQLGASQSPPVTVAASVYENTSNAPVTISGLTIPAHGMAPVVFDGFTPGLTNNQIAEVVWQNKPGGIPLSGTSVGTYVDPEFGVQTVPFSRPTQVPLFIIVTVVPLPNVAFSQLQTSIPAALAAAAIAPTLAGAVAPIGQLSPGASVIGSQLQAVVMASGGVYDVQALAFETIPSPTNTAPIAMTPLQMATVIADGTHVIVVLGTSP